MYPDAPVTRQFSGDDMLPCYPPRRTSCETELASDERAQLLDLLAKVLARAAEVAAEQPEPLKGQRIRPI